MIVCALRKPLSMTFLSSLIKTLHIDRESKRARPYIIIRLSHKDWELPNSRIWLAEIDIESGLDFPI